MKDESFAVSLLKTSLGRKIWHRTAGERSWTAHAGNFRERELHGLINRPNYTYGMLRAADVAKFFGLSEVTVCEFGVATGMGLTNMTEVADKIQAETGVRFRIVGFDTGAGLPPPTGVQRPPRDVVGG